MRTADHGSGQDSGADFVANTLKVGGDSIKPTVADGVLDLLAHQVSRPTRLNEAEEHGPQVPWVGIAELFASGRVPLAWHGAAPGIIFLPPGIHQS